MPKRVMCKTIVGIGREKIFKLVMDIVYQTKGINESEMADKIK